MTIRLSTQATRTASKFYFRLDAPDEKLVPFESSAEAFLKNFGLGRTESDLLVALVRDPLAGPLRQKPRQVATESGLSATDNWRDTY